MRTNVVTNKQRIGNEHMDEIIRSSLIKEACETENEFINLITMC
jgi:hypothetical protein